MAGKCSVKGEESKLAVRWGHGYIVQRRHQSGVHSHRMQDIGHPKPCISPAMMFVRPTTADCVQYIQALLPPYLASAQVLRLEIPQVEALQNHHTRVPPDLISELPVPDINTVHLKSRKTMSITKATAINKDTQARCCNMANAVGSMCTVHESHCHLGRPVLQQAVREPARGLA